ncbi:cupin domain-containing protein [Niveibacterium umoris]|uniref:(S)-ureidoglycine aminohydrolase cupin domain-containing protein n=1 Tax=Niveibacterium umoris TaxID=1193620 RepID=A0A840BTB3_9RHOO|nr:cupin domain-containing protein [Niveibacterium umoris]MBB4013597.1 hypothetical protein [Niveibacterium umoris]
MTALIHFSDPLPEPAPDRPRPDRLIQGNPARLTWTLHESADSLTSAGYWACEVGAWRIAFPAGKEEYFHVLEGRIRIADAHGHAREFGPGEAGVIPAGFEGSFEVIEPVRKHFVVVDRDARK